MKRRIKDLLQKPMMKKMGLFAFLFFLIKGLVWVALGVWAYLAVSK